MSVNLASHIVRKLIRVFLCFWHINCFCFAIVFRGCNHKCWYRLRNEHAQFFNAVFSIININIMYDIICITSQPILNFSHAKCADTPCSRKVADRFWLTHSLRPCKEGAWQNKWSLQASRASYQTLKSSHVLQREYNCGYLRCLKFHWCKIRMDLMAALTWKKPYRLCNSLCSQPEQWSKSLGIVCSGP